MRSLQLCLPRSWDRLDLQAPVPVSQVCLQDLQWWLHLPRLSSGVSLCQVSPDLHFWSDASDVGWGAHLDRQVASGLWDLSQATLSINARELLAVHLGLRQFQSSLRGKTVAVFCDNTTAVAYLRKEGGTRSQLLGSGDLALDGVPLHPPGSAISSRLSECPSGRSVSTSPAPSFRVVTQHGRVSIFEKTLAGPNRLICDLRQPPLFDLLLSSPRSDVSGHGRVPAVLGRSPGLCVSSCVSHAGGSPLGPAPVVRGSAAVAGPSCSSAFPARPPAPASISTSLPGSPSAQLHAWRLSSALPERLVSPQQ